MAAKIEQHHPVNPGVPNPRHNSGGMKSTPAGGEVPRDQYENKVPPQTPPPRNLSETDEADPGF